MTNYEMLQLRMAWRRMASGEAEGLTELFSRLYHKLYFYGIKYGASEAVVEDCIQNLFIKLWTHRSTLSASVNPVAYLLAALRHHITDSLAQEGRCATYHAELVDYQTTDYHSYEQQLIQKEDEEQTQHQLHQALADLSPRQRQAIYLRFFEEKDYQTVANTMDMNLQSVRNLVHRAIKTLQHHFDNYS